MSNGLAAAGRTTATPARGEAHSESFEQLDELVRVTPPRTWGLLLGLAALLAGGIVFVTLYKVPTKVSGQGIVLVDPQSLFQVTTRGEGRVAEVRVAPGGRLEKEGILVRLEQADLAEDVAEARHELEDLRKEDEAFLAFEKEEAREEGLSLDRMKAAQLTIRDNSAKHLVVAEGMDLAERKVGLTVPGMLTSRERLQTLELVARLASDKAMAVSKMAEIEDTRLKGRNQRGRDALQRAFKIDQAETRLANLEARLERRTLVVAPEAGDVTEVLVAPGMMVTEGQPVALMKRPSRCDTYQALLFVPAEEGKRIRVDQEAEVSPTTARREEYGYIHGKIEDVSNLPTTEAAALARLPHPQLIASFLKPQTAYTFVRIALRRDERPAQNGWKNGFDWSSDVGHTQEVKDATLCTAAIRVERTPLINLVIPWLKETTGMEWVDD